MRQRLGVAGRDRLHTFGTAAALGTVLERLSVQTQELDERGVDHGELLATCGGIIQQVVTGGPQALNRWGDFPILD